MATAPIPAPPAHGGLRVASIGATRRLQALHHLGYDVAALAPYLSWSEVVVEQMLTTPPQTILASSQQRVIATFKQLRAIPAELERTRVDTAKARADMNTWAGPFDWDDIDTDERPHPRRKTHAGEHIEPEAGDDLDVLDQVTTAPAKPKRVKSPEPALQDPVQPVPSPAADVSELAPELDTTVDIHDGMSDVQKRSHYQKGCREQPCRDAKAKDQRSRMEAKKAAAATFSGGEQGSSASADESSTTSSRVGDTSETVSEPSPVVQAAPTPPEPDVDEGASVKPADMTPPAIDPRDEQLILLVAQVAELERERAVLLEQLEHANSLVADELDLRTTLNTQINMLRAENRALAEVKPSPLVPDVTITVHVGGVRVA